MHLVDNTKCFIVAFQAINPNLLATELGILNSMVLAVDNQESIVEYILQDMDNKVKGNSSLS